MKKGEYPWGHAQRDAIELNYFPAVDESGGPATPFSDLKLTWPQHQLEDLKKEFGVNFPDEMDPTRVHIFFQFGRKLNGARLRELRAIFERWYGLASHTAPPLGGVKKLWEVRETVPGEVIGMIVDLSESRQECVEALLSMVCSWVAEKRVHLRRVLFG